MKKKSISIFFLVSVFGLALAQEVPIEISDALSNTIERELQAINKSYSIDVQKSDQNKLLIKTWVSGSINLKKANIRESERFERKTYSQELKSIKPRIASERMDIIRRGDVKIKPKLQMKSIQKLELQQPTRIIYREGPAYYKFSKITTEKKQKGMDEDEIIKLAKDFLVENSFLKESELDNIGLAIVQNRRVNEDGGENAEPTDYLVQQDVVFERHIDGKPVINSKIKVGILPDTKEIVLFEHFNWTAINEKSFNKISAQTLSSAGAGTKQAVIERLNNKIRKENGKFTKAEIQEVIPAWYQSENELIPILCFDVFIEHASPMGPLSRNYLEVLNLTGSDDIFFPDKKQATRPVKAPN